MERYTCWDGEVIQYPPPDGATAAFLAQLRDAAHDDRVSWSELTDRIYGVDNPIMDTTIFDGKGAVTPSVFRNPLYRVMTDLLWRKQVVEFRIDTTRLAEPGTVDVAAAAELLGMDGEAVLRAIHQGGLEAWALGDSYRVSRASVDSYRDLPALRAWVGSEPGRSLRLRATDTRKLGKKASIVELEVQSFERAAIATTRRNPITGSKTLQVFLLEPATERSRFEWGGLGLEGRFRVVRRITHPRDAAEAWRAFRPA